MTSSMKSLDHFAILNWHEHLSDTRNEEEDMSQKTTQEQKHANNDQPEKNKSQRTVVK